MQLVEAALVAVQPSVPGYLGLVPEVVDEDEILEAHGGIIGIPAAPCPHGRPAGNVNIGYITSKGGIAIRGFRVYKQ